MGRGRAGGAFGLGRACGALLVVSFGFAMASRRACGALLAVCFGLGGQVLSVWAAVAKVRLRRAAVRRPSGCVFRWTSGPHQARVATSAPGLKRDGSRILWGLPPHRPLGLGGSRPPNTPQMRGGFGGAPQPGGSGEGSSPGFRSHPVSDRGHLAPNPTNFIWFDDILGPKPYEFMCF